MKRELGIKFIELGVYDLVTLTTLKLNARKDIFKVF
jgi:hypothetical protein